MPPKRTPVLPILTARKPVLPILTTRTRHYRTTAFRNPTITIRERFTPYPSRCEVPASPISPAFPSNFMAIAQRLLTSPHLGEPSSQLETKQPATDVRMLPNVAPAASNVPVVENSGLIPKPIGEVGRRGPRGYSLEDALKWQPDEFKKLKEHISILSDKHLDLLLPFQKQSKPALLAIAEAVATILPRLEQYQDQWPVSDAIKLHLKNMSNKRRRGTRRSGSSSA